jgi:hypothetical protein
MGQAILIVTAALTGGAVLLAFVRWGALWGLLAIGTFVAGGFVLLRYGLSRSAMPLYVAPEAAIGLAMVPSALVVGIVYGLWAAFR